MKIIILLFAAISVFSQITLRAQSNIITTIAGNGVEGYNGDNIAATNAELNLPYGICTDASGNIYIAEWNAHRIRKITAATGIIATLAGTGNAGYAGDGGAATAAELWGPYDIKIDASGNIYIADANENEIRMISGSTGIITTIAGKDSAGYSGDGGNATAAKLNYPTGIALDASGNVYISDHNNNRIREVNVSTGKISTIAGTGTAGYTGDGGAANIAELSSPAYIIMDASGNMYFSEWGNSTIRKITASTGIITTIAGTGVAGYTGNGGHATNATLNDPTGLVFDNFGNLYIADANNNVVREIMMSSGLISTFAGNGTQGYSGDNGAAINAEFYHPCGLALDNTGNLIINDDLNNVVRRVVGPLAVNNITNESTELSIYPNPANNFVRILLNTNISVGSKLFVYNLLGQEVYNENVTKFNDEVVIRTDGFNEGIYLLKLYLPNGETFTKKFEIVR